MQTASETNQLSCTPQADSRWIDLRVWMVRNSLTYVAIGKVLGGITGNGVQKLLQSERIPLARHKALIEFGVPAHLLPPGKDVPPGRRPKRPKQ